MKTKIAVIQLTRSGDLIQTAQAVRQLKAENSDAHVTLIARRSFGSGLRFLLETVFDNIIFFETKELIKKEGLKQTCDEAHQFINKLKNEKFEFTINLSYSKSSGYLTKLINSEYQLGLARNNKNEITIQDKWGQFIYSNVLSGSLNPFSLVDLYRYSMGVIENHVLDPDPNFTKRANNIVIHPFASHKKKRWGMSKWSEVIYKLAIEHPDFKIHIVGGALDKADADRLLHSPSLLGLKNRVVSHAGQYSMADTYQLLMDSKLFIGHDSLVGHIASETLTPIITVSLGTVRPHETTPYSAQAINIVPTNSCFPCPIESNCDLLPCHSAINSNLVSILANGWLNDSNFDSEFISDKIPAHYLHNTKIFKTHYDENGLCLDEISNNYQSITESFRTYYKIIWLYYLNNAETNNQLPSLSHQTVELLQNYSNGTTYLYELYNFGMNYSTQILEESKKNKPNYAKIQGYINKLGEIDQLCSITKKTFPLLAPIVDYFYVNKANSLGHNLMEVSQQNILNYYDASNLIAVVDDFIKKSTKPFTKDVGHSKEV